MRCLFVGFIAAASVAAHAQDAAQPANPPASLVLGEEGCKEWLGRAVYSIDGRRLGEIAALTRDSGDRVVALNANIGGYLGFDEKRVRIGATQIRAVNANSLVLDVSEAAARNMPGIPNR